MSRLLGLDLSSNIGWALFDPNAPRDRRATFGTLPWGRTDGEEDIAHKVRLCGQFGDWLEDRYMVDPWQAIAVEAPFLKPHDKVGKIKILIGLVAIAMEFAGSRKHPMPYLEVLPKDVKKWMTGRSDADKADVIAACWSNGWKVGSEHAADACGVALIAYERLWPETRA